MATQTKLLKWALQKELKAAKHCPCFVRTDQIWNIQLLKVCLRCGQGQTLSLICKGIHLQLRAHLTPWRRWQSPICSNSSLNRRLHGTQTHTPQSSESTPMWIWSGRYTPNSPAANGRKHFINIAMSRLNSQVRCEMTGANDNISI